MVRYYSTPFGEPLSAESKKLVNEVRSQIKQPLNLRFGTDFNIYRFVLNEERAHKNSKDIIEHAVKALDGHLKIRKCFQLDELPDITFEENKIFKENFLPCGEILKTTDSANRLLWFIEYETISIEGIARAMKSSEAIRWQFRQFEHMLRCVNKQESDTGRLSSLRHIIDMNKYEINPFTMLFVSSGTLSYYSQLFHYENFPELVNPIELVNIAKWIHMPYRLIKAMMPAGFSDRFRLHDETFLQHLLSEINVDVIPSSLGGNNKDLKCIPAKKPENYWKPTDHELIKSLETIHISPRKLRYFRVSVEKECSILSWYFRSDGDIYFGVFYEAFSTNHTTNSIRKDANACSHIRQHYHGKDLNIENKETVYPWLKLSAKMVDENDAVCCGSLGYYYIVFSNKHSWLHSRSVDVTLVLSEPVASQQENSTTKLTRSMRVYLDGSKKNKDLSFIEQFETLASVSENALLWLSCFEEKGSKLNN